MSPVTATHVETERLADQLERAFRGGSWHGPSVMQALAGVDAAAARRHPIGAAHSIWELALHIGAWMDIARRRVLGEADVETCGEADWPSPAGESEADWEEAVSGVEEAHRKLHSLVLELDDGRLDDPVPGSDPTVRGLLFGVLQHNVYHAGQISLLKLAGQPAGASE